MPSEKNEWDENSRGHPHAFSNKKTLIIVLYDIIFMIFLFNMIWNFIIKLNIIIFAFVTLGLLHASTLFWILKCYQVTDMFETCDGLTLALNKYAKSDMCQNWLTVIVKFNTLSVMIMHTQAPHDNRDIRGYWRHQSNFRYLVDFL